MTHSGAEPDKRMEDRRLSENVNVVLDHEDDYQQTSTNMFADSKIYAIDSKPSSSINLITAIGAGS